MIEHVDRAVKYRGLYRFSAVDDPSSKGGGQMYEEIFIRPGHPAWPNHLKNEIRQFLEGPHASALGDYIVVSVEALRQKNDDGYPEADYQQARTLVINGLRVDGVQWHPVIWWMGSDDQAYFVMSTKRLGARAAGLDISVSKEADMFKESKYLRRVLAHHRDLVFGSVVTETRAEDEMLVELRGHVHRIQMRDYTPSEFGPLDDGIHLVTVSAARRILYSDAKVGDGYQVTILTPHGLAKGHMMVVPDSRLPKGISMILIGLKGILRSVGNLFSLGVLGILHAYDEVWTDAQSWQTLSLHSFSFDWAKAQFEEFRQVFLDEDKVRAMLGDFEGKSFKNPETGMSEPATYENSAWRLQKILMAEQEFGLGLEVTKTPGALRSLNRLFKDLIAQMFGADKRRRIRMKYPKNVAWARYIVVDPTSIDPATGRIDPNRGVLDHGQAFMGGKVGPSWLYRRPIAHKDEKFRVEMVAPPELAAYKDSPFIFVSAKDIAWILTHLGGGDQDDLVVVLFGLWVVAHLDRLLAYDFSGEEFSLEGPARKKSDFLQGPVRYTQNAFLGVMRNVYAQPLGLGAVVNRIMVHNCLRDLELAPNMRGLSHVARKLEAVIDAIVKDGLDTSPLRDLFTEFFKSLEGEQVPEFLLHRIPPSKQKELHISSFKSDFDLELDRVREMASSWDAFVEERRSYVVSQLWDSYRPNQLALGFNFPVNGRVVREGKLIRKFYNKTFRDQLERYSFLPNGEKRDQMTALGMAYGDAQFRAANKVKSLEDPIRHKVMLYLWQQVYNSPDPNDGILWGEDTANLTIDALVWARDHEGIDPDSVSYESPEEADSDDEMEGAPEGTPLDGPETAQDQSATNLATVPLPAPQQAPVETQPAQVSNLAITVVNGWRQKGYEADSPEVIRWKSLAGEPVLFRQTSFGGEDAVKVFVDDAGVQKLYGFVSRPEIAAVKKAMGTSQEAIGTLEQGSNLTMKAVIL